jgi:hypothetical protein
MFEHNQNFNPVDNIKTPTFGTGQKQISIILQDLMVETARSSETLVSNHHTTWHNNPENHSFYPQCYFCLI